MHRGVVEGRSGFYRAEPHLSRNTIQVLYS